MGAAAILARAGFDADVIAAILGELARFGGAERVLAVAGEPVVLNADDLAAEAIAAAWATVATVPDAGGGLIRLRVRGALRDARKRELRAIGAASWSIRWPWFYPRGKWADRVSRRPPVEPLPFRLCRDCAAPILPAGPRVRCADCQAARRREQNRAADAKWRASTQRCRARNCVAPVDGRRQFCPDCLAKRKRKQIKRCRARSKRSENLNGGRGVPSGRLDPFSAGPFPLS